MQIVAFSRLNKVREMVREINSKLNGISKMLLLSKAKMAKDLPFDVKIINAIIVENFKESEFFQQFRNERQKVVKMLLTVKILLLKIIARFLQLSRPTSKLWIVIVSAQFELFCLFVEILWIFHATKSCRFNFFFQSRHQINPRHFMNHNDQLIFIKLQTYTHLHNYNLSQICIQNA